MDSMIFGQQNLKYLHTVHIQQILADSGKNPDQILAGIYIRDFEESWRNRIIKVFDKCLRQNFSFWIFGDTAQNRPLRCSPRHSSKQSVTSGNNNREHNILQGLLQELSTP
ncbi:6686_t:CDS:2, partial [Funneliformis mosseae]